MCLCGEKERNVSGNVLATLLLFIRSIMHGWKYFY